MLCYLVAPNYTKIESNATKVRVHLTTGVVEIFNQHQELLGKIDNNLIEIESNKDNKFEKNTFILQDAIIFVARKGVLDIEALQGTTIYVYAKNVRELNPLTSFDTLTKELESKKLELEKASEKSSKTPSKILSYKIDLLKADVDFLAKALSKLKEIKDAKI